jgi:GDP-L-fucose synthase
MHRSSRIYLAGHTGLVGSALFRKLQAEGYESLITRTHAELDLERQIETEAFFEKEKPEYVFLAAAKVGGIFANDTYPAEFIYRNLAIQTNVIHAAWKFGVKRLLFLGSSCIYPRECPQPMKEDHMLTGPLEATNEPYAIAKIAGVTMCEAYNRQHGTNFIAVMPTNLYGPNDNFDLETSHVLPALIRKFHEAKMSQNTEHYASGNTDNSSFVPSASSLVPSDSPPSVVIWGTGRPRREFLHVDDLADACLFIMNLEEEKFRSLLTVHPSPLINIGWGRDISIKELALLIQDVVGFKGELVFDTTKPDGTPRKLLDVSKISELGWKPKISLKEGLERTYNWCLENSIF